MLVIFEFVQRGKCNNAAEDIYKIYAESFIGMEHLRKIQEEAQAMVTAAFKAAGL